MPKNSEGYDWEQDKVTFMFVNLEHQGEDMIHSVNGRMFLIKDNKLNTAPRAVFNALNDCIRTEYKVEGDINKGKTVVPFDRKLYFCQMQDEKKEKETPASKTEKEKNKIIEAALEE